MCQEKALINWVYKMVKNAMYTLNLKENIIIKLEPIGERFIAIENSAEISNGILYVNLEWLKSKRSDPDETEARLLIYHEIRHVYQQQELEKWRENLPTIENVSTIQMWAKEYENYTRNEGGDSTISYFKQSVEVDAYAFGICLLNIDKSKGDNLSLDSRSIPDEIYDLIMKRATEIIKANNLIR